jgi:4-hydroxy-3-methylbut-2-enyl diphosphate reductase
VARHFGVASYLIEEPEHIRPEWFAGVRSLALTAGASVPEELVTAVLCWFDKRFVLRIEERVVKTERVNFTLPISTLSEFSHFSLRAT